MSQTIDVNGQSINYPETGDTNWGDEATDFAVQTSAAFGKLGLASGTSVDIAQTLDVTGNTTLDANLSVGGNATISGTTSLTGNVTLANNLTVNGNTALGNANTDTITVTGIVNVDSGTLYVDPVNNRVGVNITNPAQSLDVVGNAAISGNETIGGTLNVTGATSLSSTLGVTGDVSVNTNKFNVTALSGNTTIAGTLGVTGDVAINTNKFNVTASSGNTTIAGTLGISNGTASAPSLTPSGDTNTGLYSIGSDKIGFAANGVRQGEFGVGYGGFTGNIIQVVQGQSNTRYSTSSASFVTLSDGVSITPKYTNSKFLVIYLYSWNTSSATTILYADFARKIGSGSVIQNISGKTSGISNEVGITSNPFQYKTLIYLDSPTLTDLSQITYYLSSKSGGGTITTIDNGTGSEFAPFIIAEVQQ